MVWSIASTATALQGNDKKKKQHKKQKWNRPHNLQVRLDWNFSCNFFPGTWPRQQQQSSGVFTMMQGRCRARPWSKMAVPCRTRHHHRHLPSLNCVLCNQLACSIIILQLITWAANGDQLCLKKKKKTPLKTSPTNLSAATLRQSLMSQQLNFKNKTEKDSKANVLGVNLVFPSGLPPLQQRPSAFTSFPSPPVGLRPEKEAATRNNRQ